MATTVQYSEQPELGSRVVAHIGWVTIIIASLIAWLFAGALPCRQALWAGPILLFLAFLISWLASKSESKKRGGNFNVQITWKEILALLIFVLAMIAVSRGADAATLLGMVVKPLRCDDSQKSAIEFMFGLTMRG